MVNHEAKYSMIHFYNESLSFILLKGKRGKKHQRGIFGWPIFGSPSTPQKPTHPAVDQVKARSLRFNEVSCECSSTWAFTCCLSEAHKQEGRSEAEHYRFETKHFNLGCNITTHARWKMNFNRAKKHIRRLL